jgi:hypothetical protein
MTPTPAPPLDRPSPLRPLHPWMVCDLYCFPLLCLSSRRCIMACYMYCVSRSRFSYCETTRSNEPMNFES